LNFFSLERRLVSDAENPLVLRVNLGPHDEIARLYIFDRNQTMEVNHEVTIVTKPIPLKSQLMFKEN
jgi:hypothetical protein